MILKTDNWDMIVVGTGPSGASVARELAKQQKHVLLLEKGQDDFSINLPRMLKNKEIMFIGQGKTLIRGIRTGGPTVFYFGTAYTPKPETFAKYGIDLSIEVDEVKKELSPAPLKDELIGPAAQKIMESALNLGYPWRKFDKFICQEMCAPGHIPDEAIWNSTHYVADALAAGATLQHQAEVTKVIIKGQKAVGVEAIIQGKRQNIYASKIVLSAGGVGSAQILMASGVRGAGEGFFCDPITIVQGLAEAGAVGNGIPMAAGTVFEREGFVLTDVTLPKLVYRLFSIQALRVNRIFQHERTMKIMVKVRDDLGGTIKQGKVHKVFSQADKQKIHQGESIARKILINAGAKKLFSTVWTSAHPGGSAGIGEVVDSNLKTEYDNLYVCDCSVIPNEWGLPPVLTLLALSRRLAKHLLKT